MAKIPYFFETPVPKYFRESGWFENENAFKFIIWAFSKCSPESRNVVMQGKEITLEPFEFIAGRLSSPKECFMTEKQFRGIADRMQAEGILKKTANSRANKYSCYVWVVERFTNEVKEQKGQQKGQQRANRGPTEGHNLEDKNIRTKKEVIPQSLPKTSEPKKRDAGLTDDFSFSEKEKIQITEDVSMTQEDLDACLKIKGTLEKVKEAVDHIQKSPKRKSTITDWPNALMKWKIEDPLKAQIRDHIQFTENLCKEFREFVDGCGWRCYMHNDIKRDQRGILFESQSPYQPAFFVAMVDGELKTKCEEFIINKNMRTKKEVER